MSIQGRLSIVPAFVKQLASAIQDTTFDLLDEAVGRALSQLTRRTRRMAVASCQ